MHGVEVRGRRVNTDDCRLGIWFLLNEGIWRFVPIVGSLALKCQSVYAREHAFSIP
jgi:hypothetical protein